MVPSLQMEKLRLMVRVSNEIKGTLWRVVGHTSSKIQTRTYSPNPKCLFYSYTKKIDVIPAKPRAAPAVYIFLF